MCRSGLSALALGGAAFLVLAPHRQKAHPRHVPDAKTSYSGTMLASPV
jgi:hypothetical protein